MYKLFVSVSKLLLRKIYMYIIAYMRLSYCHNWTYTAIQDRLHWPNSILHVCFADEWKVGHRHKIIKVNWKKLKLLINYQEETASACNIRIQSYENPSYMHRCTFMYLTPLFIFFSINVNSSFSPQWHIACEMQIMYTAMFIWLFNAHSEYICGESNCYKSY